MLSQTTYLRQFKRNLVAAYSSQLLKLVVSFVLTAYVVRQLSTSDWAVLVWANGIAAAISLAKMGSASGFAKSFNSHISLEDDALFSRAFNASVAITLALGGVALSIAVLLASAMWLRASPNGGFSATAPWVLLLTATAAAFSIVAIPAVAVLQANHRIDRISQSELLAALLRALATFLFFELFLPTAVAASIAAVIAQLLTLIYLWQASRQVMGKVPIVLSAIHGKDITSLLTFNLSVFLKDATHIVFLQGPVWVLSAAHDTAAISAYGIVLYLASMVTLATRTLSRSIFPLLASLAALRRASEIKRYISRTTGTLALLSGVVAAVWLAADQLLLSVWVGDKGDAILGYRVPIAALLFLMGAGAALGEATVALGCTWRAGILGAICAAVAVLGPLAALLIRSDAPETSADPLMVCLLFQTAAMLTYHVGRFLIVLSSIRSYHVPQ